MAAQWSTVIPSASPLVTSAPSFSTRWRHRSKTPYWAASTRENVDGSLGLLGGSGLGPVEALLSRGACFFLGGDRDLYSVASPLARKTFGEGFGGKGEGGVIPQFLSPA